MHSIDSQGRVTLYPEDWFKPRLSWRSRIKLRWLMLRAWMLDWVLRYPDLEPYVRRSQSQAYEKGWMVGKNSWFSTPELAEMHKGNPYGHVDESPVVAIMGEMKRREALEYLLRLQNRVS